MRRSFPITVDASSSEAGLRCAILSTEPEGVCSSVGTHWSDVAFPMREMYSKGIHFHTGRGQGQPMIAAALAFISAGRLDPTLAISEIVPFDQAPDALAAPSLKPVLSRPPLHA
jgi:threonine dehydrogenase-like Zn-dependent dehydrogenase